MSAIDDKIYWPDFLPARELVAVLDIETTGLSVYDAMIYLIGIAEYRDGVWHIDQYFAEKLSDEQKILENIYSTITEKTIIAFNGDNFDIPFIQKTYKQYGKAVPVVNSIDLMKLLKPYRAVFGLPNIKMKSFEEGLGIDRGADKSGGELISVYKEYISDHDDKKKKELLYHNYSDMLGMLKLLDAFRIRDILNSYDIISKSFDENSLEIDIRTNADISFDIDYKTDEFVLKISGDIVKIMVPVTNNTVKMYYSNYKDYFYLPMEDRVIHKSLAAFVENGYKKKAKKENCYSHEQVTAVVSEKGIHKYIKSLFEYFLPK